MLRGILIAQMTKLFVTNVVETRDTSTGITDRIPLFGGMLIESTKVFQKDSNVVQVLLGLQDYVVCDAVIGLFLLEFGVGVQILIVGHQRGNILVIVFVGPRRSAAPKDPVHGPPRGYGTKGLTEGKLATVVNGSEGSIKFGL